MSISQDHYPQGKSAVMNSDDTVPNSGLRFSNRSLLFGGSWSCYLTGMLALLAAVPPAFVINVIHAAYPAQPEKAMQVVGLVFVGLLVVTPLTYLGIYRRAATVNTLALIIVASVGVLLVACYLYSVSIEIFFPADILIWSESDFVNDIVKFRQGFPLFTAQVNNESFTYVPGTQLLTYSIAWLLGHPLSITTYRIIQLGYTLLSGMVAMSCCRQLLATNHSAHRLKNQLVWGAILLTVLFLIATNPITNPFSHLLHNDSLAQLVTLAAYAILLRYAITGNKRLLWLMVLVPALGFWVKQSLAIWAGLYCLQVAIFDHPRSLKRFIVFAITTFGALGVSMSMGYALWGKDFSYWVFTVLGQHGVSPLRSFQHVLDVWPYFAIGLIGGLVLLRGDKFKLLLGPWIIWLLLISLEAYTSGVAWMLNHIGPGCLIAGVWFLAAVVVTWPKLTAASAGMFDAQRLLQTGAVVALFCLLLSGLGVVRVPIRRFGEKARQYVGAIEQEFKGEMSKDVLLDFGSWVYAPDGVVMKDRAASIGERGYSQTGDFSGIIQRLNEKRYSKILVRNLHSPDFWYDNDVWKNSSGIREAMMNNYREIGKIDAVPSEITKYQPYGFSEISILVPRTE
jgi:hypothetical protein